MSWLYRFVCVYLIYMTLHLTRSLIIQAKNRATRLFRSGTRKSLESTMEGIKVSYVSDVEGNFDYWRRFVNFSSLLRGEPGTKQLELADPHSHFVYGGDVCDRGPGDIRVVEDIVSLKERYPDRVHIILGNRDINKMRLPFELHPTIGLQTPPKVYWLRGGDDEWAINPSPASRELTTHASRRLQWILQKTMGSPLAFEYRRAELLSAGGPCEDDDVVRSFLDYVDPGPAAGPLTKYLQYGAVAAVIGDTLFVHGAANPHNIGHVPSYGGQAARHVADVRQWAREINAFKDAEVADYMARSQHWIDENAAAGANTGECYWAADGGYAHAQPGSRLLQYGMGWLADGAVNPSVIYSWYDIDTSEPQPQKPVADWLLAGGVKRVVVGHQPRGDAPLIMRGNGVTVISADTSYAVNTLWSVGDDWRKIYINSPCAAVRGDVCPPEDSTRGNVVSEVIVLREAASVRGCLSDGTQYCFSDSDALVGSRSPSGWFVKAAVGENYLVALLEGHTVKNRLLTNQQARAEMQQQR